MTEPINSPVGSQARSTKKRKPKKPEKPRTDFPLFAHNNGLWAKKIRGTLHYFGPWRDDREGDAALAKYDEQKDALHSGRTPRIQSDGLAIRDLVNRFLTNKRHLLDTGELAARTFSDYYQVCERVIRAFGLNRLVDDLAADDFERLRNELAKKWGPVRLGNTIQRVRSVFKFGYDAGLIDKPIRFGPGFKRPSKKVLRFQRAKNGKRMFEADEIHKMLKQAKSAQLKSMILLGVNAGLGNTDVGQLSLKHLEEIDTGWLNYPRPKTGIDRRAKLWPETIAEIQKVLAERRKARDEANAELVFLTQRGAPWVKVSTREEKEQEDGKLKLKVLYDDSVSKETSKILKALGINSRRNFYALRHTFETIGGESRDQVAVDHVMGHVREDLASIYRERISDDRLVAVAEHVRRWLFPKKVRAQTPRKPRKVSHRERPRLALVRAEAAG